MSSRISIGNSDGFTGHEVVQRLATRVDCRVQVDGAAATVTAATATLKREGGPAAGVTLTVSTTFPSTTGIVLASVSTANITSLGVSLWDEFVVEWLPTFTMDGASEQEYYTDSLFLSTKRLLATLPIARITGAYSALSQSASLGGTGQTTWWYKARESWSSLRNWLNGQSPERRAHLVMHNQELEELHFHWTMMLISDLMAGRYPESDWQARVKMHESAVSRIQGQQVADFASRQNLASGVQPVSDRKVVGTSRSFDGRSSESARVGL